MANRQGRTGERSSDEDRMPTTHPRHLSELELQQGTSPIQGEPSPELQARLLEFLRAYAESVHQIFQEEQRRDALISKELNRTFA